MCPANNLEGAQQRAAGTIRVLKAVTLEERLTLLKIAHTGNQ